VGSIALQDPAGPHATHITYSAKRQLSGWQAPAAGSEEEEKGTSAAAGIRPRLFMVFEDGSGYEVLDKDLFAAYSQRKVTSCKLVEVLYPGSLCMTQQNPCDDMLKPLAGPNIFNWTDII